MPKMSLPAIMKSIRPDQLIVPYLTFNFKVIIYSVDSVVTCSSRPILISRSVRLKALFEVILFAGYNNQIFVTRWLYICVSGLVGLVGTPDGGLMVTVTPVLLALLVAFLGLLIGIQVVRVEGG